MKVLKCCKLIIKVSQLPIMWLFRVIWMSVSFFVSCNKNLRIRTRTAVIQPSNKKMGAFVCCLLLLFVIGCTLPPPLKCTFQICSKACPLTNAKLARTCITETTAGSITPIPQVIPGKQYEDDHFLLDISTITQIRINMSSDSLEKIIRGHKGTEEEMTSLLTYNHKMESIQTNASEIPLPYLLLLKNKLFRIHFEDETKGQKSIKLKGAQFDTSFQREALTVVVARRVVDPSPHDECYKG
ncbi:hypothetical protein PROFUN_09954 [Planoprotostelium fungivorum]|uniref:Uncharacterized protein n=1 Tax=Planoprotostelium fungivorum TaxID=1890364 RepID=A0A2P6NGC5_9EUKA|nr:hypothetical protein PROFUN_09954 [Planoprotostelium fungivorum]